MPAWRDLGIALAWGAPLIALQPMLASADDARGSGRPSLVAQARAYEHGEGVAKDELKAMALYCEAARGGDAEAQYSLGWMLANGRGVTRDDALAAAMFRLAAAGGDVAARKVLPFFPAPGDELPACMSPPAVQEDPEQAITAIQAAMYGIGDRDTFADLAPWKRQIAEEVAKLAPSYGIHPRLAIAIVAVESNFDPAAHSEKDARGLMQLIPQTAARFGVRDPFKTGDNIRGGLAYLQWLLAYYRGDVRLVVAAYNAGEAAVDRYNGVPPYPETRAYVQRVRQLFGRERHPYDARITEPSPILVPAVVGTR